MFKPYDIICNPNTIEQLEKYLGKVAIEHKIMFGFHKIRLIESQYIKEGVFVWDGKQFKRII